MGLTILKPPTFNTVKNFQMTERTRSNAFNSAAETASIDEAELEKRRDTEPDDSNHGIECSLNPAEVRIRTTHITVEEIISQIRHGKIYWDSDIQRSFAWQPEHQTRLIESLLLRIPIPAFYAATDKRSNWLVLDGVQRLSTIYNYVTSEFPLNRLEYFVRFNGKWYNDLPRPMQRRIEETQMTAHVVEAGTPERVRLNIVGRINPRRRDVEEAAKPSKQ